MSLATYYQDLKVFSADDDYSSPASVNISSSNPTYGRITWSGDGKWLAVAPLAHNSGPLPIFKYADKQLQPLKYVTLSNITSASFFNQTNRNIVVGNETGEVFVWDIKDKKIGVKVQYVERQSVDMITINSDDAYIASGSLISNKICLHGLKTNKVLNTFSIPKSKQTSSLKFCLCKKNYLGASSIESTVCVWDITRSEFIFNNINTHSGACTDISFSPINFDVIASVSLTKSLKMFDLREKTSILNTNIGEPMNCVDIILNGDKVALGTTAGSVIIYDLRADKVFKTFKVHNGPVLSVKTQNLRIAKTFKEVEMNTPDTFYNPSKTLDISVMDAFSPISKNNIVNNSNCLFSSGKTMPFQSTPSIVVQNAESVSPYDDSFLRKVLSPISQQKNTSLVPNSHSSPYLLPIVEKPDAVDEPVENVNTKIMESTTKPDATPKIGTTRKGGDGDGDGFHVNNSEERNVYYSDIISEIQNCHKEVLGELCSIRNEINEMKTSFESRFATLEEDVKAFKAYLTENVKQEIHAGNCDAKIEHVSQRILINELNDVIIESEEKISREIKMNAFRLMHIYEALKKPK